VLKELGYKIKLAKAPIGNPKLKYRKEVERLIDQGKFSIPARRLLKRRRDELGLSSEEADAIEAEVLQPYREHQRKLKEYEDTLAEALQEENPLCDRTRHDLRDYQKHLGLSDEDVKEIEERLAGNKQAECQKQQEEAERQQQQQAQSTDTIFSESQDETDELSSDKGVDYTKLRDFLAQGKWREADEETLAVMLKVAGREQEGWLDTEDIKYFPCTDLRTIDTLWVKYSNGRFGFSVQKRIWESVGGTPNADYETYLRFGNRVGWRVNYSWLNLNYDNLTFTSEEAPEGHLPVGGWMSWVWVGRFGRWASSLFSRVETCKL
jgi:hypothetical protein